MPPVINLLDEGSPRASERPDRRSKRRRVGRTPPSTASVVTLSDGEAESDEALAFRLQEREAAIAAREAAEADEELARRLQEEERQAVFSWPTARELPFNLPLHLPLHRLHGGAHVEPHPPSFGAFGGPPRRGFAGGHLALSLMDRDFDEADYEMLLQLDEAASPDKKALRANARLIDQLPTRKCTKAEALAEQSCVICLENLRAQQVVLSLPCKHDFHKACIMRWLKSHESPTCPICKASALVDADSSGPAPAAAAAEEWYHT